MRVVDRPQRGANGGPARVFALLDDETSGSHS
jgi:hypothetical protein